MFLTLDVVSVVTSVIEQLMFLILQKKVVRVNNLLSRTKKKTKTANKLQFSTLVIFSKEKCKNALKSF